VFCSVDTAISFEEMRLRSAAERTNSEIEEKFERRTIGEKTKFPSHGKIYVMFGVRITTLIPLSHPDIPRRATNQV
jgi:hypothetical protein